MSAVRTAHRQARVSRRDVAETIAAVLEREPDWQALPAKTPAKIRELLRQCLQKDAGRRLQNIADARRTIEKAQRGWNRWRGAAVAAAALAILVRWRCRCGSRNSARPLDRSEWVQLTKLPDPVTQPALSPDGRMLAFIRSDNTFFGPGQIYVKALAGWRADTTDATTVCQNESGVFARRHAHRLYHRGRRRSTGIPGSFPHRAESRNCWLRNASGLVLDRTAAGAVFRDEDGRPHGHRDGRGEPASASAMFTCP